VKKRKTDMEENKMKAQTSEEVAVTSKDKALIATLVVVILIVAAMAVAGFLFMKPKPDFIQGQADATEIRISGKLPGRVADIYVKEGDYVHAGDTLIHIHSSVMDAKLAQAQAGEDAMSATNRKVDAGTRSQIIQSAYDIWQQAQAAVGISKKTYDRMQNLFAQGVISEQKRDEAKAAYEAAVAGASAAQSQYELAKAGPQSEDRAASAAMVRVAKGNVNEVDALLEDQYLVAPVDGEITVIYPKVSELVMMGAPLMSLQTDDRWVTFNLRETMLKDISNGKKIKVEIPALDMETEMTVYYIKDLGTYANWQATKATGDFDARTFQVKARPDKKIENLRPGMSVLLKQ
jgi:HlyD family secretion protein